MNPPDLELEEIPLNFKRAQLPFDRKIESKIRQLEGNKNFQKIVLEFRQKMDIPSKGISPLDETKKFKSREERTNFSIEAYKCTKHLMKTLGLGYGFFMPLQDYLKYGEGLPIGGVDGDYRFGAVLDYGEEGISIRIYPEASQADVKKLLKLKWSEIQRAFKSYYPELIVSGRLKKTNNEQRDAFIFKLYKQKIFRHNGASNLVEAKRYFKNDQVDLKKIFADLKFNLPDLEQRKRIIIRLNRLAKIRP